MQMHRVQFSRGVFLVSSLIAYRNREINIFSVKVGNKTRYDFFSPNIFICKIRYFFLNVSFKIIIMICKKERRIILIGELG